MKVVMINSSPHERGCTYTALNEIAQELSRQGVESEILSIGKEAIHGCIACGQCEAACPQHLPIISLLEQCRALEG